MTDTTFTALTSYVAHPRQSSLALSPDGSRLVTAVQTLNTDSTGYTTALWEIDPTGERPAHRLTRSGAGESGASFSGSGDLYFVSSRPDDQGGSEGSALWRLPACGGEAEMLNRRAGGVSAVVTCPGSDQVAVVAPRLLGAADEAAQHRLHTARDEASVKAILHTGYPVRYWDHDLGPSRDHLFMAEEAGAQNDGDQTDGRQSNADQTGAAAHQPWPLRSIGSDLGARFTGDVHLNAEGTQALIGVRISEARAEVRGTLALVDTATGQRRDLADDPERSFEPGPINPAGTHAVVVSSRIPTPQRALQPVLQLLDLSTGELTDLAPEVDLWLSPGSSRPWLNDTEFLAIADQDGRGAVFHINTATGEVRELPLEDAVYSEVLPAPDGTTAYALRVSYEFPTEVVRIDLGTGSVTRLLNPVERPALPGTLTEVETTAEDGARVRGWLALPPEASAEKPAPLLLWIHGGPLNSWNAWSWRWNHWLAVARGYAVLLPDPALSTGYGQHFIDRGWNRWGAEPYTDLMAITDAVVARDDIDQTRTAAMGGSFGGYMANWVAGQTDRFSAIVTHASLWALSQFGPTTDMSPFWRRQIDDAMARDHSPHHHVSEITTPMLVIHGDKDYRVPIGEGLRLWYELLADSNAPMDDQGRSPHQFLYFPDENHWILKPQNAIIWYEVVFAFLAEHVLGTSEPLPEVLGV